MKKKKSKRCYLCGKIGADTTEHIPPKKIFSKEIRQNLKVKLITVPAHSHCNNIFSQDDDLFGNYIIAESYRTSLGFKAWNDIVVGSFKKNPGAKRILRNNLDTKFIMDNQSNAYIFKDVLLIDAGLMEKQIKRINRGLYFHKFKEPLPTNIKIKVIKYAPPEISMPKFVKYFKENEIYPNWINVVPNIFCYFYEVAKEDKHKGMSIMVFYDSVVWLSFIGVG
jgi:hypothetical protein